MLIGAINVVLLLGAINVVLLIGAINFVLLIGAINVVLLIGAINVVLLIGAINFVLLIGAINFVLLIGARNFVVNAKRSNKCCIAYCRAQYETHRSKLANQLFKGLKGTHSCRREPDEMKIRLIGTLFARE